MWRLGVGVVAIAAGAAVGAFVFKMVGEEQIGGSVKTIAAKFGFVPPANASGTNALDFLDKIQPGSKADLTNAVLITVAATVISTAAVAVIITEIAE
jgi:hypothetical protein